ncbi:hypothetical protein V6N12_059426 [Hibiscus sabdariffa]|uniref:Uncharacterized protein n=1 Tax=Hibiscus sabdariffa TaxID=183260 RepID=A0ABR2EVM7_9ROSI
MDNRVRRGRENAPSQCSSTRRYGAEVTHAILPGKARTTFNKRVPVLETDTGEPATEAPVNGGRNYNSPKMRTTRTWTERPYEALLFPGIGFGLFLRSLGGRRRRPPFGGPEPSVRYHSGRARILTLCQDLRAKGQSQPIFVSVESFSGMFRSSSPLRRKSEPPVQVQDTIITAWTIRHPTRNRNDPIARAELYQLSYIPRAKWSMHEGVRCFFYSFPWRS